ncbi:MAG: hypothetical protein ACRC92_02250 [Peptostreptococcaceae bacterium]
MMNGEIRELLVEVALAGKQIDDATQMAESMLTEGFYVEAPANIISALKGFVVRALGMIKTVFGRILKLMGRNRKSGGGGGGSSPITVDNKFIAQVKAELNTNDIQKIANKITDSKQIDVNKSAKENFTSLARTSTYDTILTAMDGDTMLSAKVNKILSDYIDDIESNLKHLYSTNNMKGDIWTPCRNLMDIILEPLTSPTGIKDLTSEKRNAILDKSIQTINVVGPYFNIEKCFGLDIQSIKNMKNKEIDKQVPEIAIMAKSPSIVESFVDNQLSKNKSKITTIGVGELLAKRRVVFGDDLNSIKFRNSEGILRFLSIYCSGACTVDGDSIKMVADPKVVDIVKECEGSIDECLTTIKQLTDAEGVDPTNIKHLVNLVKLYKNSAVTLVNTFSFSEIYVEKIIEMGKSYLMAVETIQGEMIKCAIEYAVAKR